MIAVTNRHLVKGDFFAQMEKVIELSPKAIILREKDVSIKEYDEILGSLISFVINKSMPASNDKKVAEVYQSVDCASTGYSQITVYIHSHMDLVSKYINIYPHIGVHFPFHILNEKRDEIRKMKSQNQISVSVSCHTIDEVSFAATLGADQVILGNIFETDCKKGLPGKGLAFLSEAVASTILPVYGIGGITLDNINYLLDKGAAGGCMMSGFMYL
ncbi:MAG: thiamine phosphate synthase [Butyrivibrio sp.]|nr:thiamine phosphate synthase [Butyrivibrio sp.]